jgi:hypothetical protein
VTRGGAGEGRGSGGRWVPDPDRRRPGSGVGSAVRRGHARRRSWDPRATMDVPPDGFEGRRGEVRRSAGWGRWEAMGYGGSFVPIRPRGRRDPRQAATPAHPLLAPEPPIEHVGRSVRPNRPGDPGAGSPGVARLIGRRAARPLTFDDGAGRRPDRVGGFGAKIRSPDPNHDRIEQGANWSWHLGEVPRLRSG